MQAGTAWLVVSVNGLDRNGPTFLELMNPLLNEAECYAISPEGPEILNLSGDNLPFRSRAFEHRNFTFPLKIEVRDSKALIIKTSTFREQFLLPMRTRTREELKWRDDRDNLVRGSYYRLVVFVLLFNLFIFLMIREVSSFRFFLHNLPGLPITLCLNRARPSGNSLITGNQDTSRWTMYVW